jgi:hypothetical protein
MGMKKKTQVYLNESKLVPISVFSSTDPTDLDTGYSEISRFELTAVVAFVDGRYRVFSDVGENDSMYVMDDNSKTMPLPLSSLIDSLKGRTLVGYDLERFGLPLIKHYLSTEHETNLDIPFYDILKETYDAYETHTGEGGKRFDLFNLAYWNACENSINAADLVGFTQLKMIKSWHFGGRRKGIRLLRNQTIWCGELAHRIFKYGTITVRDHRTKKKVRIPIKRLAIERPE